GKWLRGRDSTARAPSASPRSQGGCIQPPSATPPGNDLSIAHSDYRALNSSGRHRTICRVGRIRVSRIALALGCLILSSAVEAAPRYSGTIVAVALAGSPITLNEPRAPRPGG